jgi:hypothetical protein
MCVIFSHPTRWWRKARQCGVDQSVAIRHHSPALHSQQPVDDAIGAGIEATPAPADLPRHSPQRLARRPWVIPAI